MRNTFLYNLLTGIATAVLILSPINVKAVELDDVAPVNTQETSAEEGESEEDEITPYFEDDKDFNDYVDTIIEKLENTKDDDEFQQILMKVQQMAYGCNITRDVKWSNGVIKGWNGDSYHISWAEIFWYDNRTCTHCRQRY